MKHERDLWYNKWYGIILYKLHTANMHFIRSQYFSSFINPSENSRFISEHLCLFSFRVLWASFICLSFFYNAFKLIF